MEGAFGWFLLMQILSENYIHISVNSRAELVYCWRGLRPMSPARGSGKNTKICGAYGKDKLIKFFFDLDENWMRN